MHFGQSISYGVMLKISRWNLAHILTLSKNRLSLCIFGHNSTYCIDARSKSMKEYGKTMRHQNNHCTIKYTEYVINIDNTDILTVLRIVIVVGRCHDILSFSVQLCT